VHIYFAAENCIVSEARVPESQKKVESKIIFKQMIEKIRFLAGSLYMKLDNLHV